MARADARAGRHLRRSGAGRRSRRSSLGRRRRRPRPPSARGPCGAPACVLSLVELVLELLDREVDGREAVGRGRLAAHVVARARRGSPRTPPWPRSAGCRSSEKCTSARSIPPRKRLRRPIFSSAAARSAGEMSVCRALTVISKGMPPGSRGAHGHYTCCRARRSARDHAGRGPRARPPARSAAAAAARVAPVVATSSTSSTGPAARAGGPRTPGCARRSPAVRPAWAGPGSRRSRARDREPPAAGHGPGEQLGLVEAAPAPARGRRWAPR